MYCNACGTNVAEGQTYCGHCGRPMMPVQAAAGPGRVASHITLLGSLWIAYGILTILGGVMIFIGARFAINMMQMHGNGGGPPLELLRPLLAVIGNLVLVKGVLSLAAGWGLLQRAGWARMLTLVLGCISLINIPFGTAIGIFSLWVLLSANGEAEYRMLQARG